MATRSGAQTRSTKKSPGRPRTKRAPKKPARQTLLILGASGDLTGRLLLPGLGGLLAGDRGRDLLLLGSGMEDWTQRQWQRRVRDSFATQDATGPMVDATKADTEYIQADVTDPADLKRLLDKASGPVSIFFALPPPVTVRACQALRKLDLPPDTRLVMEKPFGTDAASATELNRQLEHLVPEEQIYRVDHFLGKSTVLNLLGLRFANRLFEPALNNQHVEKIEVIFDEALGLEGRAGYYDGAGALVDMIQSHLLQVLSLLTMQPPPALNAVELRDRKADVFRAIRIWNDDPVGSSRRARWTAGTIGRRKLPAYSRAPGVDPARKTETLAEMTVEVDNWRWTGVPITLRSGKALGTRRKEAIVTFKRAQRIPDGFGGHPAQEQLVIGFGPDDMRLRLNVNGPGDPTALDPVDLLVDFGPGELSAYGEVLGGVLDADPSLSVRGDSAVDCWRIVQPVLDAWKADKVPLDTYPAGSDGPRNWRTPLVDPAS